MRVSTPPTISAANASDPTTVARQYTSAWVSQISAKIANTAATITMTRPMASVRMFSDISARNSAISFCARSLDSRRASPRSFVASSTMLASAQVGRGLDAASQANPLQGASWRLAPERTRAYGLACRLVREGIGPHAAAQLQRDRDVCTVQPALGFGQLVIGEAPVRAVAQFGHTLPVDQNQL